MTPKFFVTSLFVILLPSTGVLYTIAFGLGSGWRASVVAAAGCTLGIIPHIVVSILSLTAVLHASAVAFEVVRYLGVLYLFYMASSMLQDGGVLEISGRASSVPASAIVLNGF